MKNKIKTKITWKTSFKTAGHFEMMTHSLIPHLGWLCSTWNCPFVDWTEITMNSAVDVHKVENILFLCGFVFH